MNNITKYVCTPFVSHQGPRNSTDHGPLARYVKLRVAHAPGMPGTFSPPPQVSDPDMHHGTCMTHVPWCMPGSLTRGFLYNRRRGKTIPAFPGHAQPAILRIWQEAHAPIRNWQSISLCMGLAVPLREWYGVFSIDNDTIRPVCCTSN